MAQLLNVFSIPIWKTNIDNTRYDKETVLGEMLHNFSVDPKRNAWDEVEEILLNQIGIIQIMMMAILYSKKLVMLILD